MKIGLFKFSFQNIWRFTKLIFVIQLFNLAISYFVWLSYEYIVSGWTIVALSIGYTAIILAIKNAQENQARVAFK